MSRIRKVENEEVKILPQSPNADISSGLLYEDKSKLNFIERISDTKWFIPLMIGILSLMIIPAKIINISSDLGGGIQSNLLQILAFVLGISIPLLVSYMMLNFMLRKDNSLHGDYYLLTDKEVFKIPSDEVTPETSIKYKNLDEAVFDVNHVTFLCQDSDIKIHIPEEENPIEIHDIVYNVD